MKRTLVVLAAALALPALLAAQTPVDKKRPAAPDGVVSIENLMGSIKVTGWERAEVEVKGTLGPGVELELGGTEKQTKVEVEPPQGHPMGVASEIEVSVPAASAVRIEGFQATITVAGVTGTVKAETVNGSITHNGASKEVTLQSVNGAVETTKASGRVHAETVNGTVTVRDASGELEASAVNGKLQVAGGSFARAHLESVGGGVRFDGSIGAKGTLSVETVSGAVDLFLPPAFGADFTVSSFSGEITNELGPAAEKKSDFAPGKELSFTSGAGGAHVSVQTLSGAIRIHKRP